MRSVAMRYVPARGAAMRYTPRSLLNVRATTRAELSSIWRMTPATGTSAWSTTTPRTVCAAARAGRRLEASTNHARVMSVVLWSCEMFRPHRDGTAARAHVHQLGRHRHSAWVDLDDRYLF